MLYILYICTVLYRMVPYRTAYHTTSSAKCNTNEYLEKTVPYTYRVDLLFGVGFERFGVASCDSCILFWALFRSVHFTWGILIQVKPVWIYPKSYPKYSYQVLQIRNDTSIYVKLCTDVHSEICCMFFAD